ncbi:MAG: hypothetical protein ACREUO_12280 [Burkholderiales bacterium]
MTRTPAMLFGAALLVAALAAHAQAPSGAPEHKGRERGHRVHDCSKAPDPAKCEANRREMHERMKAAREACKDKPDRRACMSEQMCAKAQDPARCQAQAKERARRHQQRVEERQKAHEACTGKRGDELAKCLHQQRGQRKPVSGRSS